MALTDGSVLSGPTSSITKSTLQRATQQDGHYVSPPYFVPR